METWKTVAADTVSQQTDRRVLHTRCSLFTVQEIPKNELIMSQKKNVITDINPLKTKRRPLYLKTHSVPRCKHFSPRL